MKSHLTTIALLGGIGLLNFPLAAGAQPVATTLAATSVTSSNATINGTVNPNGAPAASYFQYGLTTNYGNIGGFMALPATNTALTLPGLVVNAFHGPAGASWTNTGVPSAKWTTIASSADGTRLAAAVGGFAFNEVGPIYTSTNAGITWTQSSAPMAQWFGVASSADGTQLAAVAYTGGIYTSTNAGVTWTATTAPVGYWASIASSADGTRLAAVVGGQGPSDTGPIYTSTNAGATWTQTSAPIKNWQSIASSADGLRLAAAVGTLYGTGIYTSTDGGVTWTNSGAPGYSWNSIASSADGMRLAAAAPASFNRIWISTNGGFSWTQTSTLFATWQSVASSADGMRLAATAPGVGIYTSTDGGVTWAASGASNDQWYSIASSADGSQLAAVVNGGGIVTSTGTVSPLAGFTTCHYRAVALNSVGTSVGDDLTFTTGSGPPTVATLAASSVTQTNARLNGTVNPNEAATSAYFQYGLTTNYGSYSATNMLVITNITLSVSNLVTNLTPLTTYHFQLVASNSLGMAVGGDLTLKTLPLPPIVTTLAASNITATNAALNGTVNPNGAASLAYFRYGLTTSYGSYSATNTLAATNDILSVSNLISSLAPATTYHFQLVAGNSGGISQGNDMTFTTSAAAPTPTTLSAGAITQTSARLNGTVNANGADTSAWFQYGLTTNYGSYSATNVLVATNVTMPVSNLVTSLTPLTTYHFQLVASNSLGTSLGNDLTFFTPAPPAVTTLSATSITPTNATVNGTVNPNGPVAVAYFQYGLTTNYGNIGGFTTLPATNSTQTLPGLAVNALQGPAGSNWIQSSAAITNWYSIASSADGTHLAAGTSGASGRIYTSANSGATWKQTSAAVANWVSIASSADGTRLAAAVSGGRIYTSTNSGTTWTQTSGPSDNWNSIASSADGTQLAVVSYVQAGASGRIYTSTNGGGAWTPTSAPVAPWESIASSADGSHLAAVVFSGGIYTSADNGVTWTPTSAPSQPWNRIACSADGTQLAATIYFGGIYTSTNSGSTWTPTTAPSATWQSIASSADGTQLAAVISGGRIYASTNSGSTWTPTSAPSTNWGAIASSAAGGQLAAVVAGGGIYISAGASGTLTPGTTCHYRAVALNSVGASIGDDLTFTTSTASPTTTTLPATGIMPTNATLNGMVNPSGAATAAYFQYGLTTNYGSYSATNTLMATNITLSVSNLISSLTPGMNYHFQLVAGNSAGTNAGADMQFTTTPDQAVNFSLTEPTMSPGRAFQFSFTNISGLGFTVLGTTNLSLPLSNWTVLGAPVEGPPGYYQFTDPQATNSTTRFYRVRSP